MATNKATETGKVLYESNENRSPFMYQAECAWYRNEEGFTVINYQKGNSKYLPRIARVEAPQFIFLDKHLTNQIANIEGVRMVLVSANYDLYVYIENFQVKYSPIFNKIEELVAETVKVAENAHARLQIMSEYSETLGVC